MNMKATRDAYGKALLSLGDINDKVVVLDADLSRSTRTEWFKDKFPDRFYNLGIAEANMAGVAAGMSDTGLIPFITTYAIFIGRAFDQIRQSICYANKNVKIVASHSGLAASYDGGSHQGIEDIALMRSIPGMTVLSPADYNEAYQAVFEAAKFNGPVYIRLQKEPSEVVLPENIPFQIGGSRVIREGNDVTIFVTGSLLAKAVEAADQLAKEGIFAEIINMSTLKPLDEITVLESVKKTGRAITIEEHTVIGGLHEAIASVTARNFPVPVYPVAIQDCFGETGSWNELLNRFKLNTQGILEAYQRIIYTKG